MQVTNGLCYLTNHVTETMLLNDLRNPGFELCSTATTENQPLSCFLFLVFFFFAILETLIVVLPVSLACCVQWKGETAQGWANVESKVCENQSSQVCVECVSAKCVTGGEQFRPS